MTIHTHSDQAVLVAVINGNSGYVLGAKGEAAHYFLELGRSVEDQGLDGDLPKDNGIYVFKGNIDFDDGSSSGELGGQGDSDENWGEGEWHRATILDLENFPGWALASPTPENSEIQELAARLKEVLGAMTGDVCVRCGCVAGPSDFQTENGDLTCPRCMFTITVAEQAEITSVVAQSFAQSLSTFLQWRAGLGSAESFVQPGTSTADHAVTSPVPNVLLPPHQCVEKNCYHEESGHDSETGECQVPGCECKQYLPF
jgi:hypothetical protein